MELQNETVRRARTACLTCRTGKRRCDRALPNCGLCVRREADCRYPARQQQQLHQHQHSNQAQHVTNDSPASTSTSLSPGRRPYGDDYKFSSGGALPKDIQRLTNAVYFIAPQFHLQAQLELPRPSLPVPGSLLSLVGSTSSIRSIASFFFATIHPWLPIVSKRVFYTRLLNPLAGRGTELRLLTLSMKLCCSAPAEEEGEIAAETSLYDSVKRFFHEVESAGFLSIHVLQAGILIALYELGQAIYPAAYLTVGVCARHGLALGVNKFALASNVDDYGLLSWNEIEDRRRVWWAILIFDR
jgi:hypothetical protein